MNFQINDTIKAFHFQPMPNREDSFVVGRIVAVGTPFSDGVEFYTIITEQDVFNGEVDATREGEEVFVPIQTFMGEFEGRVTKVEAANLNIRNLI